MLFCEIHDLVWEIISVFEKRMKNCIVKIIDNVFEKNDKGGLFPLNKVTNAHFSASLRCCAYIYTYLLTSVLKWCQLKGSAFKRLAINISKTHGL